MNETGNNKDKRAEAVPQVTYFVRAGDSIKIGVSHNFKRRFKGLQAGVARPLEVLAVFLADHVDEYQTHQQFAHLRERGEWFRAGLELLLFIENAKATFGVAMEFYPGAPKPKKQPKPPRPNEALIRDLIRMRAKHGADSAIGWHCSNLLEQLQLLPTWERKPWQVGEMQTLPWFINQQLAGLAKLTGGLQ